VRASCGVRHGRAIGDLPEEPQNLQFHGVHTATTWI
jgi:hypothetical protein